MPPPTLPRRASSRHACAWVDLHPAESLAHAATFGDTPVPVAGPGAPLVSEFAVAEYAAALGVPTETGKAYLGEAVGFRHRLPRLWARVQVGDLPAWRGRRIARDTMVLTGTRQPGSTSSFAPFAHRIRPSQVDRLLEEAVARFMPAEARRRREAADDQRHVTIHTEQVSFTGTVWMEADLDLADALDLDTALSNGAAELADLGSTGSLEARRSEALGQLARRQLAFDLQASPDARQVVLNVHVTADAITDPGDTLHLARVDNTRSFVDVSQVRDWCAIPGTTITVRPVIDLRSGVGVGQYEIPGRLHDHVAARDHTCVFPWCTRPARCCDNDHIEPHATGGVTHTGNLAPLCRRHHRLKTHGRWSYTAIEPGTYLWTSPHADHYLRDHAGTRTADP